MSPQQREPKLHNLLALCAQRYREIARLVPEIESDHPVTGEIPEEQHELLEHEIDLLLLDLKEVEKLLSDASLEGSPQSIAQGPLRFYRKITKRRPVLETLLARLLELEGPLSDLYLNSGAPPTPILTILKEGFRLWVEQGPLAGEFNERVEKLLSSDFFHPDKWLRNADDVMPVLGTTRLRPAVDVRLREIYRSFVLGNYVAAIALSRAVLERSLIECSSKIGIDVSANDPRRPHRTKRLEELVEDASERLPHLRVQMESIREAGNKALHPKSNDGPAPFPLALRKLALESIQAIRSVVEELYLDAR